MTWIFFGMLGQTPNLFFSQAQKTKMSQHKKPNKNFLLNFSSGRKIQTEFVAINVDSPGNN